MNLSDTCLVRKILVIDDDREIAELLRHSLAQEGFELSAAHDGEEGLVLTRTTGPEIVLLDVNLPDINGFEVLRRLRRESDVPILMLTARGEDVDRIVGLEIGADDYLPKPFNVRELVARINAVLRRASRAAVAPPSAGDHRRDLTVGAISLDLVARTVRRNGTIVAVTASEFDLLRALMESPGIPLGREDLSRKVFDRQHSPFDRSIDNLISALRRKIGATPEGMERIKSIRNVGYVYADVDRPRRS
jgi:two-component system, OmpR family, response regulator CpxR